MFQRYAIFYTPTGTLADLGAAWLGWDSAAGREVPRLALPGIDAEALTARPHKYGFHATLKAPFGVREDHNLSDLQAATRTFAAQHAPVTAGSMTVQHLHGFMALRPVEQPVALSTLAAAVVRSFDYLRAPLSDARIAQHRNARLTARQEAQMLKWGYPYVFEDFRFHLTLTGRVPPDQRQTVQAALFALLDPAAKHPFVLDAVTLMGEDPAGRFHQICRCDLTGSA